MLFGTIPSTSNHLFKLPWTPPRTWSNLFQIHTASTTVVVGSRLLFPRGLINQGNTCFFNAILQPLVYCPLFSTLFYSPFPLSFNYPVYSCIASFFIHFYSIGLPFSPLPLISLILNNSTLEKGHQHDAEEFLGLLLDLLHNEFILAQSRNHLPKPASTITSSSSEWTRVSIKKNTTRSTTFQSSPVTDIFSGLVISKLTHPNGKISSTLDPFSTLQLSCSTNSITESLLLLNQIDLLTDYVSSGKIIHVKKQVFLEKLPQVLVLHLKRFVYDTQENTTNKINKFISYDIQLKIPNEILSINQDNIYSLFAVVYHHGGYSDGGHYTCNVFNNGEWFYIDDDVVSSVDVEDVLRERNDRVAYMLFYNK